MSFEVFGTSGDDELDMDRLVTRYYWTCVDGKWFDEDGVERSEDYAAEWLSDRMYADSSDE